MALRKDDSGDLINVYKYLRCRRQRDEARLLPVVCGNGTRETGTREMAVNWSRGSSVQNFYTVR